MKRITIIGVAALAALALTAFVGAASASASVFIGNEYPTTLRGEGGEQRFFTGEIHAFCNDNAEGFLKSPNQTVSSPAGDCANVKMNGCEPILHAGAEESKGVFAGTFDIGGPKCTGITVDLSPLNCVMTFGPQGGFKAIFENQGEGLLASVKVTLQGDGLKYTHTGTSSACKSGIGGWYGGWNMTGQNESGSRIGVHLSENHQGVFMGSKGFEAEKYPAAFVGDQNTGHLPAWTFGELGVSCTSSHLGASASAASTSLGKVYAEYGGCKTVGLFQTTVKTSTCPYVFSTKSGPPYAGGMEIYCTSGEIEIVVSNLAMTATRCIITIGSQSLSTGMTYENIGAGSSRGIVAEANEEGIAYTLNNVVKNGCTNADGKYTNGAYKGGATLYGWSS